MLSGGRSPSLSPLEVSAFFQVLTSLPGVHHVPDIATCHIPGFNRIRGFDGKVRLLFQTHRGTPAHRPIMNLSARCSSGGHWCYVCSDTGRLSYSSSSVGSEHTTQPLLLHPRPRHRFTANTNPCRRGTLHKNCSFVGNPHTHTFFRLLTSTFRTHGWPAPLSAA